MQLIRAEHKAKRKKYESARADVVSTFGSEKIKLLDTGYIFMGFGLTALFSFVVMFVVAIMGFLGFSETLTSVVASIGLLFETTQSTEINFVGILEASLNLGVTIGIICAIWNFTDNVKLYITQLRYKTIILKQDYEGRISDLEKRLEENHRD